VIKKKHSEALKERYAKGDILDKETRKRVAKAGSDGWVKKLNNLTEEEKSEILKPMHDGAKKNKGKTFQHLDLDEYMSRFPTGKGIAKHGNCSNCQKRIIVWVGGKPRPKLRFCGDECKEDYFVKKPQSWYHLCGKPFYSKKMQTEFFVKKQFGMVFCFFL